MAPLIASPRCGLVRVALLVAAALAWRVPAVQAQPLGEDPVEQFRQALLLEENKSLRYKNELDEDGLQFALEFRERNLKQAAANLKNLSQLARALLLTDWPRSPRTAIELRQESPFDRESRKIERGVREAIARRIVDRATQVARSGTVAQKETTASMIGETVAAASELADEWRTLSKPLLELADVLETMTADGNTAVRDAAARALGQFPSSPTVAARALKRLLAPDNPVSTRKAAAEALVALAEGISTNQPVRASIPNVSVRETRRTKQLYPVDDLFQVVEKIIPSAAIGLTDESVEVRRQCALACREAADAVAFEIRQLPNPPVYTTERESPYPPPARKRWSKTEIDRATEGNKELERLLATLLPALRVYRDQADAFARAAVDPDPTVRLEARRAFDSLARARNALRDIRDLAPKPPAKPSVPAKPREGADAGFIRPTAAVLVAQGEGVLPAFADDKKADDKKANDKKADDKTEPDEDPVSSLLDQIARRITESGFSDPNPPARRAMLEAVEALGKPAARYIDRIVAALDDRDLFVRWIAARTLGKLAPERPDLVVPALIRRLDDEDLDPRQAAMRALGKYGPLACDAIGPLVDRLGKGDPDVRVTIMRTLEDIGQKAAAALPTLAKSLTDPNPRVRGEAARVIGRFGPLAADYVSALQPLTSDLDLEVRRNAIAAILNIASGE
ncbi:MAG: HEAT repeat domain-containing protein [Gemmataceae bacterium]